MKKHNIAHIFVLAILAFTFMGSDHGKKSKKIQWKTFEDGLALAKKENKLLVVDFYTEWCHWCKVMDKDTYGDKGVIGLVKEHAVMSKVNPEISGQYRFREANYSGRQLSMMFGVKGFPTTAFINAKGELLASISGFIPAEKFTMILKYLAGNWYDKMEFNEFVKKEQKKNKN
ncbi:MAG: thioredoxin family protein [bacterium]